MSVSLPFILVDFTEEAWYSKKDSVEIEIPVQDGCLVRPELSMFQAKTLHTLQGHDQWDTTLQPS